MQEDSISCCWFTDRFANLPLTATVDWLMFPMLLLSRNFEAPKMRRPIKRFHHKSRLHQKLSWRLPSGPVNHSPTHYQTQNQKTVLKCHTTTAIMADGIDRKADERMEFSTSKDVTVIPTFDDMHLKGEQPFSANANLY
jgi:hypothetical protein